MKQVQILGTGCPKCKKMAETADEAARALGLEYEIVKVSHLADIMQFGVMMTPALAVDGQVKVSGRVPSPEEMQRILADA